MDATRIHLFITHLPVFGLLIGIAALVFGMLRNDKGVKTVSLAIIIVSVAGGLLAFQTGEAAEETVESIAAVTHDAVEEHEEAGELANIFFFGLGIVALAALYVEIKGKAFSRKVLLAVLLFSAITFYLVARTAGLGGKIRHTEIVAPA